MTPLSLLLRSTALVALLAAPALAQDDAPSSEDAIQLDTVVVTAEEESDTDLPKGPLVAQESAVGKLDRPIIETPRSVSVITEQRMEDQESLSVQEALQYSAGVYAGAFGNDVRGDWSYIRGAAPVQYLDGLKSLYGFYNNTRSHPDTLRSIEVLKGPASVEYGQGSVGGIVNLNSKLPEAGRLSEVTAELGSFGHKQLVGDFNGKASDDGDLLYRMVLLGRDANTQVNYVDDDSLIFQPALTWLPTDATSVTLLANIQENRSGTSLQFLPWAGTINPGPLGPINPDVFLSEPGWDRYDTSQRALTGMVDHYLNDAWAIRAAARYSDSSAAYNSMWPDFPPTLSPTGDTTRTVYVSRADAKAFTSDVRLTGDFTTGIVEHNTAFGVDFQDAETDNDNYYGYGAGGTINVYNPVYGNIPAATPITDFAATTTRQAGIYAQDSMTIGNWIAALGARRDRASTKTVGGTASEDYATSLNAGLMYHFDNGIAPYVSYAESFNPVIGAGFGGAAFRPVEGTQYEAGIKYQPPGTRSLFTAAVFDITEENRTTSDPVNPGFSVQTGEVGIQGVELEAQTAWRDFDILANYSFLNAEVTRSNSGDAGTNVAYVPDHLASSWVTWRPSDYWEGFRAGAGVRFVGHTWGGSDAIRTPTYTLFDAMLGYDIDENLSVQLNAKNLADDIYIPACGARGDCAYGSRRTVIASTSYRF